MRWGDTRLFQSLHTRRYLKSSRKNIQIIIKYYDSFLWNLAFVANGKALNASGNTAGDICEATFGTAGKWFGVWELMEYRDTKPTSTLSRL